MPWHRQNCIYIMARGGLKTFNVNPLPRFPSPFTCLQSPPLHSRTNKQNVDKQKRKADQAASEYKRAAMKLEALRQDIQNEGTSMELLKALRLPANDAPGECSARL